MKVFERNIKVDKNGNMYFRYLDYLIFYEKEMRPHLYDDDDNEQEIHEGLTVAEFMNRHHDDSFADIVKQIVADKRLDTLQQELVAEGKQVCMFNLYVLCMYLVERNRERYVFLLKPTIGETPSELKNVTKITFTNEDGSKVESSSKTLIDKVLETMEANKEYSATHMEFLRLETWDKLTNNAIIQSCFVHDLSQFMNKYFDVKRKKGAIVSTKEVELIMYMMQLFGLSKVELTNKRYWQLMNTYKQIDNTLNIFSFPTANEGDHFSIVATFMPYSIWSKGKINWTKEETPKKDLNIGDYIQF